MSFTTINPLYNVQGQISNLQQQTPASTVLKNTSTVAALDLGTLTSYGFANNYPGYCTYASDNNGNSAFAASGTRYYLGDAITKDNTLFQIADQGKVLTSMAIAKMMENNWFTASTTVFSIAPDYMASGATGYYLSNVSVPAVDPLTNPAGFLIGCTGSYTPFSFTTSPTIGDLLQFDFGMEYDVNMFGMVGSAVLSGEVPLGLISQGGYFGGLQGFHLLQATHCYYDQIVPSFSFDAFTGVAGTRTTETYSKAIIAGNVLNVPADTGNVGLNYNLALFAGPSNNNDHLPFINRPGAVSGLSAAQAGAPYGNVGVPLVFYGPSVEMLACVAERVAVQRGYLNFGDFLRREILTPAGMFNTRINNLDPIANPAFGRYTWTGTRGQVNTLMDSSFIRSGYGGGVSPTTLAAYTGVDGNATGGLCSLNAFGVIDLTNAVPYTFGMSPTYYTTFSAFLDAGLGIGLPAQFSSVFSTDGIARYSDAIGGKFVPAGSIYNDFVANPTGLSSSTGWYNGGYPVSATINDIETMFRIIENKGVAPNGTKVLSPISIQWLLTTKNNALTNAWNFYGLAAQDTNNSSLAAPGLVRINRDVTSFGGYGIHDGVVYSVGSNGTACYIDLYTGLFAFWTNGSSQAGSQNVAPILTGYSDLKEISKLASIAARNTL